jgi:hypothetical protein
MYAIQRQSVSALVTGTADDATIHHVCFNEYIFLSILNSRFPTHVTGTPHSPHRRPIRDSCCCTHIVLLVIQLALPHTPVLLRPQAAHSPPDIPGYAPTSQPATVPYRQRQRATTSVSDICRRRPPLVFLTTLVVRENDTMDAPRVAGRGLPCRLGSGSCGVVE